MALTGGTMKQTAAQPTCSIRRGYSLLELLLVLAILVSATAMAVPPLMDRLARGRVQDGGATVLEVLAGARRFAIEAGVDYHFRYEMNGTTVVAIPADPLNRPASSYSGDSEQTQIVVASGELEEGLSIAPVGGDESGVESLEIDAFCDLPDAGALVGKTWSLPVLFRFDGTADDGRFHVLDEAGRSAEIRIRGLTGAATASQVFERENQ